MTIGAHKAIRDFDGRRTDAASFRNFLVLCVRRQVQTAVTYSTRRKFAHLNERVAIDVPHGDDVFTLADVLPDGSPGPHEMLELREDLDRLCLLAAVVLSDRERMVLAARLNGDSYERTAPLIGADSKAVDNALQRIRANRTALEAIDAAPEHASEIAQRVLGSGPVDMGD